MITSQGKCTCSVPCEDCQQGRYVGHDHPECSPDPDCPVHGERAGIGTSPASIIRTLCPDAGRVVAETLTRCLAAFACDVQAKNPQMTTIDWLRHLSHWCQDTGQPYHLSWRSGARCGTIPHPCHTVSAWMEMLGSVTHEFGRPMSVSVLWSMLDDDYRECATLAFPWPDE